MDKVKITREQADLLDKLVTTKNVALIFQLMSDWKNVLKSSNEMIKLHNWYISDTFTVSKSLINGYEVEETPEDKVRDYFNDIAQSSGRYTPEEVNEIIINVLNDLNIKIVGVNHD